MASRFCRQCGAPLDSNATFCGTCGAPAGSGADSANGEHEIYRPATHAHILTSLPNKTGNPRVWLGLALLTLAAMCVAGGIAYAMRPQPYQCNSPRECLGVRPPHTAGPALPPSASFHSSAYGFSLEYPDDFSPSNTNSSAINFSGTYRTGPAQWTFFGQRANGHGVQQFVTGLQASRYPQARFAYSVPDANLGYTPGYGAVYDLYVNTGSGQSAHQRLVIIAAVKHNLAVIFYGTGPYVRTSLSHDAHPNPAQTPLVHETVFLLGTGTVLWPGDPSL